MLEKYYTEGEKLPVGRRRGGGGGGGGRRRGGSRGVPTSRLPSQHGGRSSMDSGKPIETSL